MTAHILLWILTGLLLIAAGLLTLLTAGGALPLLPGAIGATLALAAGYAAAHAADRTNP